MKALEAERDAASARAFLDAAKGDYFQEETSLVYLATPGTSATVISPPAGADDSDRLHMDLYAAAHDDMDIQEQDDRYELRDAHLQDGAPSALNSVPDPAALRVLPANAPFPTPPITPPPSAPMPALSPNEPCAPNSVPSVNQSDGPMTPESHAVRNADIAPGARSFEELVLASTSANQYQGEECSTHIRVVALPAMGPAHLLKAHVSQSAPGGAMKRIMSKLWFA